MFLNCSTRFERHTAHHQELKNCNCIMAEWELRSHSAMTVGGNHKRMQNQRLQLQFLSSWWWAVCRSKHFEQLRNTGIVNSTTRSYLAGYFYRSAIEIWIGNLLWPLTKCCLGATSRSNRCTTSRHIFCTKSWSAFAQTCVMHIRLRPSIIGKGGTQ